jgi:hypothetical protein
VITFFDCGVSWTGAEEGEEEEEEEGGGGRERGGGGEEGGGPPNLSVKAQLVNIGSV